MKRAVIHLNITAHELVGHELRELIPRKVMEENGVPISTLVSIDGEDEEDLCNKIKEWIKNGNQRIAS